MPGRRVASAETLKSERLGEALDKAVGRGETAPLFDLLARSSGLPSPRPNFDLARAMGQAIAARGGRADPLLRELLASPDEFPRIVAALALAFRSLAGIDPKGALAGLQDLAEDPRRHVRSGVVEALALWLAERGAAAVVDLRSWMDGYLQAHLALEALADRTRLAALPTSSGAEVMARLDEAFALADASPRSAERSHGMRSLRVGLPAQIAAIAARFPEALGWIEEKAKAQRPETREVVAGAIAALRKGSFSDAEARRLGALLTASAKPPRDPSRIVHGTRRRGRS
jgi:hypothetical protein